MNWTEGKKDKQSLFNTCRLALFGQHPKDRNGLKQMLQKYYSKRAEEFAPILQRVDPSGGDWE